MTTIKKNSSKYNINQIVVLKCGIGLKWDIQDIRTDTTTNIIKYKITRRDVSKIVNEDDIAYSVRRHR